MSERCSSVKRDESAMRPFRALIVIGVAAALVLESIVIALNLLGVDSSGTSTLDAAWRIDAEWTVPEMVQYAKWVVLAAAALVAHRFTRLPSYLVWAAIFAFAGLDDAFSLHERFGRLVAIALEAVAGIDIRSGYFEFLWLAGAALAFLLALRRARGRLRVGSLPDRYTPVALALLVVYGAFAIGLDALQTLLKDVAEGDPRASAYVGVAENAGELVVITLLVGFSLWHTAGLLRRR